MLRRSSDSRSNGRKAARKHRDAKRDNGAAHRKPGPSDSDSGSFVLYVEGARDREILACWARRIDRDLARVIERHAVILGGRRPARAVADFRKRGGAASGLRGLVVLDRDDHADADQNPSDPAPISAPMSAETVPSEPDRAEREEGLEIFVWSRRHIESYLLVPDALRRLLGLEPGDRRIERFVDDEEHGPDALHAKRILGAGGSLSEVLGAELRAGEIARAMRSDEFHPDIFDLFARIARAAGLSQSGPEVVVRVRST